MKILISTFAVSLLTTTLFAAPGPFKGGALPEDESDVVAPPSFVVTIPEAPGASQDLPAHFDWRSVMPPVDAQGDCGSCTSFAVVAALEGQLAIACGRRHETPLSRQFNFSCGGGNCRAGWKLSQAVQFVTEAGVPDEPCLPYRSATGEDVPCSAACQDSAERAVRGIGVDRPTTGFIEVAEIKRALLKGPLVSSLILYEDLRSHVSGVYRHRTGNQLGSHAVVLVGWNDADEAWIARNSWGPGFADGGYFEIAWDDDSLPGRYTWLFDVSRPVASGICAAGFSGPVR